MYAFKKSPNGPNIRSGIRLPEGQWVLVEEPTDALLNDPGILNMEVTGPNDPKLANLKVFDADAEPTPDAAKPEATQEEVLAYLEKQGLVMVPQKEIDQTEGKVTRLEESQAKLQKSIEDLESDLSAEKQKGKDAIQKEKAEHAEEVKALKTAHAAEIDRLKKAK